MEISTAIGGLLPLWLLGVGLLFGLYQVFTTPKASGHPVEDNASRRYAGYPAPGATVATGTGRP